MNTTVTKPKTKVLNRLSRLEGQVRGLAKMVEEERDCREVLTLLAGVKSALDGVGDVILEAYLEGCQDKLQTGQTSSADLLEVLRLARR
jgi:CsoR family transcriptional regulator, copper-sensing transcriptional repressor